MGSSGLAILLTKPWVSEEKPVQLVREGRGRFALAQEHSVDVCLGRALVVHELRENGLKH